MQSIGCQAVIGVFKSVSLVVTQSEATVTSPFSNPDLVKYYDDDHKLRSYRSNHQVGLP